MDTESKYGLMEQDMKENGEKIKHLEEESFGMLMEMSSTENGRMTRQMGMAFILM